MIFQNRYVRYKPRREVRTPLVRFFRAAMLFGVWIIVGLAGLAVSLRMVA